MNTPPRSAFNVSKGFGDSSFNKSTTRKSVKFDQSVDIQQRHIEREKELQKRIQEKLDEEMLNERIEQLRIDEKFREVNGIPQIGNFGSPIPADPFQESTEVASKFGNSSPSINYQQRFTNYNSPKPKNDFSTSKRFTQSKSTFGQSIKILPSTNFNSSRSTSTSAFQSSSFKTSNSPVFNNFNLSRQSSTFQSSTFKSSMNNSRFNDSYKTALCFEFRDTEQCSHGIECRFAHGIDELRLPRSNYVQQKMCKYVLQNLPCPYNQKCKFRHH